MAIRMCQRCGKPMSDFAPPGLCPNCLLESVPSSPLEETAADPAPAASPGSPIVNRQSQVENPKYPTLRYFGDYQLLNEIARGGMGVVYKARQVSLNRTVAVKMILAGQLASAAEVQRFRAEAEAAANLRHPNIVAIHEIGEHEGQHFFSMDYVEGKELAQVAAWGRGGVGWFRRAAGWVQTLAQAIHYA